MMNNKVVNFLMFTMGAAIGSVATWKYIKKKYEQIAQDEINSVKEVFSRREADFTEKNEVDDTYVRNKANQAKEKPDIAEYTSRLNKHGYTSYSNTEVSGRDSKQSANSKKKEDKEHMNVDKPYVIDPEEFGEIDEYEKISLTYYADQILADDNDELVEDVEDVVGFDSLNHFGEYEDDAVFVRNDRLNCDYEILLDQRKYSDVIKRKPHEVD